MKTVLSEFRPLRFSISLNQCDEYRDWPNIVLWTVNEQPQMGQRFIKMKYKYTHTDTDSALRTKQNKMGIWVPFVIQISIPIKQNIM